jgi:hypothetical protein
MNDPYVNVGGIIAPLSSHRIVALYVVLPALVVGIGVAVGMVCNIIGLW